MSMVSSIDMATALELPMGVENEAKFVALRNLQLKKIKQLMGAIDGKDKEIAKLKVLNKDNRRTQMIQALRDKIRDMEMINDIIKEELVKRSENSLEEVNELIMKKTLGGPKRFRPLTREEMENKIIELEKKTNLLTNKKLESNRAEAKSEPPSSSNKNTSNRSTNDHRSGDPSVSVANAGDDSNNKSVSFLDSTMLVDEIQKLKATISAKDNLINTQRDEIVRLRARNGELIKVEEDAEYYERQFQDMKEQNLVLTNNLEDLASKLAEAMENASKFKSEASVATEFEHAELLSLQHQCEKLLKQNSTLLKSLADAENALERYEEENSKSKQRSASAESSVQSKDAKIHALEDKLTKCEEKIRQLETRCGTLELEAQQVPLLKEQLREKNIQIKEIKRNLDEREKIAQLRSSAKSIPTVDMVDGKGINAHAAEEKELKRNSDGSKH
jgi:hypothetical protein